ncbi:MAG: peptidoglycan DD-metalloendopeptidase family protein [Propionibacteriaceae bacterium]|nr:peptidoglycan DD-metalloendopeptidase family protein [Propionibacteriaceae bacterium]
MRTLTLVLVMCLLMSVSPVAHADPLELRVPVPGRTMDLFDAAATRYSSGHRGVDLAAHPGQDIAASAAGVVHFAGMVAGRPSISVDHGGGLRTTYTPAVATVSRGQQVTVGQIIGAVGSDEHCRSACLHWGLTDGIDHFDPMFHRDVPVIRLLPLGSTPRPRPRLPTVISGGGLPVSGRTSSPFGMRTHPITGFRKLHDGTDIAAPCGTPVVLPWPGRVVSATFHSAYGYRVIVEHGGLRTAYAHLRGLEVHAGDTLPSGSRVGHVGSTGLSTGCHLHWMAWRNGALVDPLTLLD